MQFKNQTIIVTGGGRGIGRGIVDAFLNAQARLIICGRNTVPDLPVNCDFIQLDIRQAETASQLIDFALQKTGRIDCLINNAGGSPPVASQDASPRFTRAVIDLNLLAPLYLAQAAHDALADSCGSIINIASVSAIRSSPGTVAYGAAKAGLVNATTSLAMEWAPHIRVNAIIAGLIKTPASLTHYGGKQGMAYLADNLPMKRMGHPEDIARACLFLANKANSYVSGACLEVYGGGEPPSFLRIAQDAQSQAK